MGSLTGAPSYLRLYSWRETPRGQKFDGRVEQKFAVRNQRSLAQWKSRSKCEQHYGRPAKNER
jgi:hypothetical protein